MDTKRLLLWALLAAAMAGCPSAPTALPDDDAAATDGGLPTRGGGGLPTRPTSTADREPDPEPEPAAEPLTDFEEAMSLTWRRWQVRNAGSDNEWGYYEYVSFNEDRTACRWKYGQDSSTSLTDEVFDESDYPFWEITRELYGGNYFLVEVEGSGLDYEFDFVRNRLYPSGFDTLIFAPTTDGKSCFVRGGASY